MIDSIVRAVSAVASLTHHTMSISFSDSNIYPGHDHSLSQLLCAAKRKLQDATFGLRYVCPKPWLPHQILNDTHRIATSVNKVEVVDCRCAHSGSLTLFSGHRSRTGCIRSPRSDSVLEAHVRAHTPDPPRCFVARPGLLLRRR